ncbi:unnamed protein product [Schistosoma intercalatum]|nr:unnamed protein product [Schistosoma intercalatum]
MLYSGNSWHMSYFSLQMKHSGFFLHCCIVSADLESFVNRHWKIEIKKLEPPSLLDQINPDKKSPISTPKCQRNQAEKEKF